MARLTIIVAFPLMRHTERLWRRRTGATRASREPERLASARIATDLRVLIAKADQPPSVSTANGKKLIPHSFSRVSKICGPQQLPGMPRGSPPHEREEITAAGMSR